MAQRIVLLFVFASIFALAMGEVGIGPQPPPSPSTPNTTTTSTTSTTSTPITTSPPNTTTTSTTTSAPNTTTAATTTSAPTTSPTPMTTPAPTPAPKPEVGRWTVFDTKENVTCIIAEMAIQLNVSYERADTNKTAYALLNVPKNDTKATGDCGNETQTLTLAWVSPGFTDLPNIIKLTFSKNDSKNEANVNRIDVIIQANPKEFVGIANVTTIVLLNNQSEFETTVHMSYKCSKVQSLNLTTKGSVSPVAVLDVSGLQIESFHTNKDDKFSSAKDCEPSSSTDYVPIGVGCGLVALVAIVLIAYLVGRRRSQARGYLSM